MARIHPTAVVDPRAVLADDVLIGPWVVVDRDVELGAGVELVSHVHVTGRTSVGARTRVFPFTVLGADPEVRAGDGGRGALVIGADNVIREHVSIHRGSGDGAARTSIGGHNLIMNHVHVAHDCRIGSHCEVAAFTGLSGHVQVEDHAVLGGKTGIHQFVRVGESAFTGGGSMLTRDAPPFARVAGDRARFAGLNTRGLLRRGFSGETIAALKHAMHLLFHSKLRLASALERIAVECAGCPEVARLTDFVARSERGFVR